MKAKKYKHLSFADKCIIEEFLNYGYNFTQISNHLGKDRTTISKEFLRGNSRINIFSDIIKKESSFNYETFFLNLL